MGIYVEKRMKARSIPFYKFGPRCVRFNIPECEQAMAASSVDRTGTEGDNHRMETEGDWYCIRYQDDDGLIKGRKIEIIAPQMQKDYMLGFLAIQIQKKKKILGIRKNNAELDSKTVAELIDAANNQPK